MYYLKFLYIKKYGIENIKPSPNPMSTFKKLDKDRNGKSINNKIYRGMIGPFFYFMASSVCICACIQANPKESHLYVIKKIFKYLKRHTILRTIVSKKKFPRVK